MSETGKRKVPNQRDGAAPIISNANKSIIYSRKSVVQKLVRLLQQLYLNIKKLFAPIIKKLTQHFFLCTIEWFFY